jgi:hypothetical protein
VQQLSALLFDRRFAVPTLRLDIPSAAGWEDELARRLLAESPFYDAVELRNGGELVARAERDAPPDPPLGEGAPFEARWPR